MKAKRLWIARGGKDYSKKLFFSHKKMTLEGFGSGIGMAGSLCTKTVNRLTGLKLKPGQQIKCKVTQLKKGFKVEKV